MEERYETFSRRCHSLIVEPPCGQHLDGLAVMMTSYEYHFILLLDRRLTEGFALNCLLTIDANILTLRYINPKLRKSEFISCQVFSRTD